MRPEGCYEAIFGDNRQMPYQKRITRQDAKLLCLQHRTGVDQAFSFVSQSDACDIIVDVWKVFG